MRVRHVLFLCLGMSAFTGSAIAQSVPPYDPQATVRPPNDRLNLPDVLKPERVKGDANREAAIERFRIAYASRKSPRIAVFWNRTLSDDVEAQRYRTDSEIGAAILGGQTTSTTMSGSSVSVQPYGYGSLRQGSGISTTDRSFSGAVVGARERVRTEGQVRSGDRPNVMAETDMWRFQDGFEGPFLTAGARLVDRNTIIRVMGDTKPEVTDRQRIETSALRGLADVFVEVLQVQDRGSPSGYVFRAIAKDVNTGQIIATVTSDGADKSRLSDTAEYVPTSNGYEARTRRTGSVANGSSVAIALMEKLSQSWAR